MKRLQGDTEREANSTEVVGLKKENEMMQVFLSVFVDLFRFTLRLL